MRQKLLVLALLNFSALYAQEKVNKLPNTFLGYGWGVGFPYDKVFIPSEKLNKIPAIKDFFVQERKYGIRVNEEDNAIEALRKGSLSPIKWHSGENDSIIIVPVMAYYSLHYTDLSAIRRDTAKTKFEPYHEMLQVYSYKGKTDSVFYRFGMDFDIELRVIDAPIKTKKKNR